MLEEPARRPLAPTALAHFPTVRQAITEYCQAMPEAAALILEGLEDLDPETMPAAHLGARLHVLLVFLYRTLNTTVALGAALEQLFERPVEPDWVQMEAWDLEDEAAPTD
jgi:hypothetical protein